MVFFLVLLIKLKKSDLICSFPKFFIYSFWLKFSIEETIRQSEAKKLQNNEKEQINPTNINKKVHTNTNKDQQVRPTPPASQINIPKLNILSNQENIKPPKAEQGLRKPTANDVTVIPRKHEVNTRMDKPNNNKPKEVRVYPNQIPNESQLINLESFQRNKLKYLPHVQIKDSRYGNSLVPVLPSFLIRDN